ncbi:hypothetical protein PEPS_15660 [Persicobacter psychrovividus]|uniref:Uncharacterized protein n=1 Tax=Persicobacter psychrovividus TaxID=387638 RepID=A0ABM7VEB0_9BACT|nr:hypothetical protein PEPS_15660 [Persicobacter psychrovividus]
MNKKGFGDVPSPFLLLVFYIKVIKLDEAEIFKFEIGLKQPTGARLKLSHNFYCP